jgi:hypothetical protein
MGYTERVSWEISLHPEVEAWYLAICASDPETADLIKDAIDQLAMEGPTPYPGQSVPQHERAEATLVGDERDPDVVLLRSRT